MNHKQLHKKSNMTDEYLTPEYAIYPISQYLKEKSNILCPFDDYYSSFVRVLTNAGHNVWFSHIKDDIHNECNSCLLKNDFFKYTKDDLKKMKIDYIISNPPFSLKNEIIERLIDLNIPFAMLMPINILEGVKRFKQFKRTNIELLLFDKRICFNNNSKPPVATMYLCSNILPEKLILETLEKKEL